MSTKVIRELYQESVKKNLEENKIENREIETKKKEIKNQQKLTDIDLDDKSYELYKEETSMIITLDKIDTKKDISKELIESLTIALNRATAIEINSQFIEVDNISNFQLKNQKADSAKKVESEIDTIYCPRIEVKGNKTYDPTTQGLYCQDEIDLRRTYKDCNKKISNAKEIHVEKDKHEAFKDHERPTEPNEETQVKNRLKTFSYCQEPAKMEHIDKIIECYSKIDANKEPDIINDLECTCEDWKKRVKMLKRMTKKPKDKDQNETKKQEEHGRANLNFLCETWMNKVNNLKRIVKTSYKQKYTKRHKIVNIVQDAETLRKDEAQSIRLLPDLKSGYQELKVIYSN
ncbi:25017_t:CDS:2 [Gigaspora margarita]|uniref:25017_t:CDS:1 n=1 Tax=Gigaspora margarita TaxID=4874 RepID=A0ABN7V6Z3_GIGMA|nr:25017_t:CDS:2 [Gigaspora margarita]